MAQNACTGSVITKPQGLRAAGGERADGRGPRSQQAGGRVGGLAHLAAEPKGAWAHLNAGGAGRVGGCASAVTRGRARDCTPQVMGLIQR